MSAGRLSCFIRRLRGDLAASQRGGLSDAQLLDRWLIQHDEAAFEVLLWRHGPMVLGVCRRLLRNDADVEDAFQAAFLLFVRKASAIRRRESIAAWLYQTAYRVALRARKRSAQQKTRETSGVDLLAADVADEVLWRDVRPILDDEINRLPEKYRVPFIRCYLEGCTNEEAAVELGCPVGTIHSRLAWARERLRARLTQRGVTLATTGLTALLAREAASAAVPLALADTTLQAAFAYAAHTAIAAGVSAGAVALTKGVLRTMFLAKLKVGVAVVLALTMCGGTGGMVVYHLAEAAACPPRSAPVPLVAPLPAPQAAQAAAPVRTIKVPSEAEGKLVFLATEVKPGETVPEEKKIVAKSWMMAIRATDKDILTQNDKLIVPDEERILYRKWKASDGIPPARLALGYEMRTYRKLSEGDVVEKGQLLGQIDSELSRDDLRSKISKLDVALAELQTSAKTKEEAKKRYDRMVHANERSPGSFAQEEVDGALLTWQRYLYEEQAKAAALIQAQREVTAALTILRRCEIRSPVRGVVKVIHSQEGEAVKKWETVLEILPQGNK
jgi:RNA polymerase sigma factor (sigma-70 family)